MMATTVILYQQSACHLAHSNPIHQQGGLKNLNRELAAYDLLCKEEDESLPDGE